MEALGGEDRRRPLRTAPVTPVARLGEVGAPRATVAPGAGLAMGGAAVGRDERARGPEVAGRKQVGSDDLSTPTYFRKSGSKWP
jgi:hypothetical protein